MPEHSLPSSLIPANDSDRLQELHRYQVLAATNERILDELAALTARLFQTPISLISLVDKDDVVFRGNFGLPGAERVARNLSLCSVGILQDATVVFENLKDEPCELTDPTVARQLDLQFYAGHPLRSPNGYNIGTLCVIDRQPRSFSPAEETLLQTLAGVVIRLLELRLALSAHSESSFVLWDPVYKAIEGQLSRLQKLADEAAASPSAAGLTPAMTREAAAIARIIDQLIAATLVRI